ncbi:MAG: geranylgeranylglycerol-phosphate geranylgeranyltransferase [Bacteroidia bacterium]
MLDFLKLIRFPNLLILAFTEYMLRWFLIKPVLELKRVDIGFSVLENAITETDFFLFSLSTVMIAAAGYIINDYFDVRIDDINRPSTNVVGKTIKRRVAMGAHMVINILGCGIGIWLSYKYDLLKVGSFIYITVPALLWFYSTNLKKQFLIGNIVIALITGLIPIMVMLFELTSIYKANPELVQGGLLNLSDVYSVGKMYALFAFVISLLREIIKDAEDYEGDMAYGGKTAPIVLGIAKTKMLITGIAAVMMALIGYIQFLQQEGKDWMSFGYFTVLLQLPFVYLIYRINTAKGKNDWRISSLIVKLIMIAGVSYLFVYASGIYEIIAADVS